MSWGPRPKSAPKHLQEDRGRRKRGERSSGGGGGREGDPSPSHTPASELTERPGHTGTPPGRDAPHGQGSSPSEDRFHPYSGRPGHTGRHAWKDVLREDDKLPQGTQANASAVVQVRRQEVAAHQGHGKTYDRGHYQDSTDALSRNSTYPASTLGQGRSQRGTSMYDNVDEIEQLKQKIENLEKELEDRKEEIQQEKQRNTGLERALQKKKIESSNRQAETEADYNSALRQMQVVQRNDHKKIHQLQEEIQQEKQRNASLERALQEKETESSNLQAEIEADYNSALRQMQVAQRNDQKKIHQLQISLKHFANIKEQLQAKEQQCKELEESLLRESQEHLHRESLLREQLLQKKSALQERENTDNNLRVENESLQEELESAQKKIYELRAHASQVTQYKTQMVREQQEVTGLRNRLLDSEARYQSALQQKKTTESELSVLRQEMRKRDSELLFLQQELKKRDSERSHLQRSATERDSREPRLHQDVKNRGTKLSRLQQEMETKDSELSALQQGLYDKDRELSRLQQEVYSKDYEMLRLQKVMENYKSELSQCKNKVQFLQDEMQRKNGEISRQKSELEELRRQMEAVGRQQHQMSSREHEVAAVHGQMRDLQQQQQSTLHQNRQELEQMETWFRAQLQEKEVEIGQLKRDLQSKDMELLRQKEEVEELRSRLDAAGRDQQQMSACQREIRRLHEELEKKESSVDYYECRLTNAKELMDANRKENDRMKQQMENLQRQLQETTSSYQSALHQKEEEVEELRRRLDAAGRDQQPMSASQREIRRLHEELEKKEGAVVDYKHQLESAKKFVDATKQEKDGMKQQMEDLQRQLQETTSSYQSALHQKEKAIEELRRRLNDTAGYQSQMERQEQQMEDLQRQLQERTSSYQSALHQREDLQRKNDELQKKNQDLYQRLSSMASERMRQDNACVEDLSDPVRHSVVVSKWQALMNGEYWTLFEIVQRYIKDEKQIAQFLCSIFQRVYNKMQDELERFEQMPWEQVVRGGEEEESALQSRSAFTRHLTREEFRALLTACAAENPQFRFLPPNELRRVFNASSKKFLKKKPLPPQFVQDFNKEMRGWDLGSVPVEACHKFADEVLWLCYLMALQTPPMALVFDSPEDKEMDTLLYEPDGDRNKPKPWIVNYVILPPLLRQKDGAILSKGNVELK